MSDCDRLDWRVREFANIQFCGTTERRWEVGGIASGHYGGSGSWISDDDDDDYDDMITPQRTS